MSRRKGVVRVVVTAATFVLSTYFALPAAPVAESANRASMETFQIPSHGQLLNALVYVAAGAGPHPMVILLHGFPGNERNLDLAQDIRRASWTSFTSITAGRGARRETFPFRMESRIRWPRPTICAGPL